MERTVVFGSAKSIPLVRVAGVGDGTLALITVRLSAPLVTHRFPLEAYDQAYQMLRAGFGPRGKIMLEVGTP